MDNDRTSRTFKATYKTDHLKVKIFKRLAVFGLAITLVHASLPESKLITDFESDHSISLEDKNLLENIIANSFVENITDEKEKNIAILESYFYDYIFKSSLARLAASKSDVDKMSASYYKSLIYGNPQSEVDVDPASIFGRYVKMYTDFHDERANHTAESKENYIAKLSDLAGYAERELNNGIYGAVILPYDQYKKQFGVPSVKQ